MRHRLIIGNWKLNGNKNITKNFIKSLCTELSNISFCDIAIAPPAVYLYLAKQEISNINISLSAQNVDINLCGAFTGETSADMLKDIGVKYVIIGHSERRTYHKETNDFVAKKFQVLKQSGLIPVLCIGETQEENEAGKTEEVCSNQIDAILKTQGILAFQKSVIAYEPIWSIGTGKSANPIQVQKVHNFIRNYLKKQDTTIAEQIIIQYGGSVNDEKKATEFFMQPDIDGILVGGASLKLNVFISIIRAIATTNKNLKSELNIIK
ncbi:triose-phosphate isomerase [Pantoea sp. Aalb]|uniref:triose-phosphate isomerase n=1 Tax=Pantoea sp. Aalb TaxID=2576762 RepID=UPI0013210B98|nr:triose-phosphate isomerase [Pantoea sp. Aalb]MXP67929.1 triose-phosphate isomerase [Pantoea sp. Aalb]